MLITQNVVHATSDVPAAKTIDLRPRLTTSEIMRLASIKKGCKVIPKYMHLKVGQRCKSDVVVSICKIKQVQLGRGVAQ